MWNVSAVGTHESMLLCKITKYCYPYGWRCCWCLLGVSSWLSRSTAGGTARRLLQAELVAVAFGRVSRTVATRWGRSFLVNESVPQCFLEAGLVVDDVTEDAFLFPFRLEVVEVEVTALHGLACVDSLHSAEALMIHFTLMCCCDLLNHAVLHMRSCLISALCGLILLMAIAYVVSYI